MSALGRKFPAPVQCRDIEQLPLKKHVSREAAGLLGTSAAILAAVAIAAVAAAFYVSNDLKVQDVQVSDTQLVGFSCRSISKLTASKSFNITGMDAFMRSQVYGPGWKMGLKSDIAEYLYEGVFGSVEDCYAASGAPSCTINIVPSGISTRGDGLCNLTLGGQIVLHVGLYNYTSMQMQFTPPNAVAALTAGALQYAPPQTFCAPYVYNPPYLCTRMARLSSLQIAAQSLSIGSSVHAGWLLVGAFLLAFLPKHCGKRSSDAPEPTFPPAAPAEAPPAATLPPSAVAVELTAKAPAAEGGTENPIANNSQ